MRRSRGGRVSMFHAAMPLVSGAERLLKRFQSFTRCALVSKKRLGELAQVHPITRALSGTPPSTKRMAEKRINNNTNNRPNNNSAGEQHTPAARDDRIVFGIINKQESRETRRISASAPHNASVIREPDVHVRQHNRGERLLKER